MPEEGEGSREGQRLGQARSGPFREGEPALLIDAKGRRYLVTLGAQGSLQTHLGVLPHGEIIGKPEGTRLETSRGAPLLVLRPTLADFVLKMRRATQVSYPKDIGAILLHADIYPGAVVLEAGLGSGALTLALLRAVGEQGRVISYEMRPEMLTQGLRNIESYWGHRPAQLTVREGNIYEGIAEREVDRVVLDLPEPWQALEQLEAALRPGGIILSFLPTTAQVHQFGLALQAHPSFDLVELREVLERPWEVTGRSLRPAHRMVAHTGFLVTARKVGRGPE